ncbi:epithelial cell-transforming sequence 2 oncogene-like, partial [Exaiptasia diaphana]|uniref:DH domain-containing protein n=1 Tax=Exaiptasia diaphana TaxID=2652724 RepID=A0A913WSI4_EXADI
SSELNEVDSDKDYASEDSADNDDGFSEILTKRLGESAGEKRTSVAQEILQTETEYMEMLNIVQKEFKSPLNAALKSNRAIISLPNIKALFDDMETLFDISSVMLNELSKRLQKNKWNSHQCLGDIFMKFTTTSRAYTNFLNNYPITLTTLQRCKEQNPQFRSFLSRHEKQPNTKMMSFAEFLLLPGQRVKSYVDLLQRFLRHTPKDHVDRKLLFEAINKIQDLADIFKQYEERLTREKFLQRLQTTIGNCPVLSEKGRHFICSEDFALLSSPTTGKQVKPEYRYCNRFSSESST